MPINMVHKTVATDPSFFKKPKNWDLPLPAKALTAVDVGGEDDGLYQAIAVALIDDCLSFKNKELARKLLTLHANDFKQEQNTTTTLLRTPVEHLDCLLKNPRKRAQFIAELAESLERRATTMVYTKPRENRPAFIMDSKEKPLSETKIPLQSEWMTDVVSLILEVPIEVSEVTQNKPIPKKHKPIENLEGRPIFLRKQDGYYFPRVNEPGYFNSVKEQTLSPLEPKTVFHHRSREEIRAEIEREDKLWREKFDSTTKWLNPMVEDEELTESNLIPLFEEGINNAYSSRVLKYGSQEHFQSLLPASISPKTGQDNSLAKALAEAIARQVASGHLKSSVVESRLDKREGKPGVVLAH